MVLTPAGNEELRNLDERVSLGRSAAAAIKALFNDGAKMLSSRQKSIIGGLIIPFIMLSYNAQGQNKLPVDSLQSEVLANQKGLFDDLAKYLYNVETHKWGYDNWAKSSLDLTKNTSVKLTDLLSKNQGKLSQDDEIKLKKEMKEFLEDEMADKLFAAISQIIVERNKWYRSPNSIDHIKHVQKPFPFDPDVNFYETHTVSTPVVGDTTTYRELKGVTHKKYIKTLLKEIDQLNGRQSGIKPTKDQVLAIVQKIGVTPVSGGQYKKSANKVDYASLSGLTQQIDKLLHLPSGKKLTIAQIQSYLKAGTFTVKNVETYLDPSNKLPHASVFVKRDASGSTSKVTQSGENTRLVIPKDKKASELESQWEQDLLSTYTEALKTYKTDLESADINKRKIAEQNFAIKWYDLMMAKIKTHVDTYLKITVETFTAAPEVKK